MNGAPAEHIAKECRIAHYCDVLGIRAFAGGLDLAADLDETTFRRWSVSSAKPSSIWSRR